MLSFGRKNKLTYTPKPFSSSFYQICQFRDSNGQYEVRKVLFNEQYAITNTYVKAYNKDLLEKFIESTSTNKYKIYPVAKIEYVDIPNGNDLMESRSGLLC